MQFLALQFISMFQQNYETNMHKIDIPLQGYYHMPIKCTTYSNSTSVCILR